MRQPLLTAICHDWCEMKLRETYNLTHVINARGVFTPLGVSRSSKGVTSAVAEALSEYFILEELQDLANRKIVELIGGEAATIVHCAAAGITLSIAATMAGTSPAHIRALPNTTEMRNRVVLPACHAVNYGQPIEQAIRLAGAIPIFAGNEAQCTVDDIVQEIAHADTCCVMLVSSRLTNGQPVDLERVVEAAHQRNVPVIIDGAAQDMRIKQLLSTKADLVIVSVQKYLAGPTAGLAIGTGDLVKAIRAQEKGIGRAMKASKEAIIGAITSLEERERSDLSAWIEVQSLKTSNFIKRITTLKGVSARSVPDPTHCPFDRVHLKIDRSSARTDASQLAVALKSGQPSIWVMDHKVDEAELVFELVHVSELEIEIILSRLLQLLN